MTCVHATIPCVCLLAVHAKADLLWGLSDYKIRRTTYNPRLVGPVGWV